MKMIFRFLVCFYVMGYYGIQARTPQEIKAWFFKLGIECNNDNVITPEEIQMLRENKIPESKNGRCMVACIFKKTGMLDSKGMFDVASSIALAEKDYADLPKEQEKSKKLMETCKKVNDEPVTDGEAGCERAVILYKCIIDNAPQLDLQLP